jgi:hypothetical protein
VILLGLLCLSLALAQDDFPDPRQTQKSVRLNLKQIDADLDRAAALWKRFKMPVPPPDAIPVHVVSSWSDDKPNYEVAFLAAGKGTPEVVYMGTRALERSSRELGSIKAASWNLSDAVDMKIPPYGLFGFPEDTTTAGAVIATLLNHKDFAKALLANRKVDEWNYGPDAAWIGTPVDPTVLAGAGFLIATHLVNELTRPDSDRRAIRAQIAGLQKLNLVKKSPFWPRRDLRELLKDLDDTLKPSRVKPDSAEAAVDDLVNFTGSSAWSRNDKAPPIARVKSFGLTAVPALARALAGRQLTRSFRPRFNNAPPSIVPVSWIAADALRQIAAGELGEFEGFTSQDVLAWYRAKASGSVDSWLLESVVENRTVRGRTFRVVSGRTFRAIALSHPTIYGEAVRRLLKARPPMNPWDALYILDQSNLTRAQKREIFLESAASKDIGQRFDAMRFLHKYAPEDFDKILADSLEKYQGVNDQSYSQFAWLVAEAESSAPWDVVAKVLPKVSTETRMEMLAQLPGLEPNKNLSEKSRTRALDLLARFFDDESRPRIVKGNRRFGGGLWTNTLAGLSTVGRAALEVSGRLLDMPELNEKGRSAPEWAAFRKEVERRINERHR